MAEYVPDHGGRWLAAVRDEALLVLPADRSDDLLALWPRLDADAAAHVIDRLAGSGITAAPSFALVVRERTGGAVRVLVRGALSVTLGDTDVSGSGVSTWQERAVDGRPEVRVSLDGAGNGTRLPIVEGVVAASAVDWGAASTQPRSMPDAEPAASATGGSVPAAVASLAVESSESGAAPDERTMVPEDTVAGISRTERPRIERPTFERRSAQADPAPHHPSAAETAETAAGGSAMAATPEVPAVVPVIVPPDFGSTPPATPAAAASASVVAPPATPSAATTGAGLGDHDGLTVAASDLRRLRAERGATGRDAERPAADTGREAAASAASTPVLALRLPDGSIEPIVGELVLGRAPAIGRVTGTRVPRPVVIGAGDPDISRTHLRVAVEGGTAVVTDLDSRNGTQVVAPGQPPMRLRPSEATPVLPDTVIDLGGGWSIQVVMR